MTKSRFSDPRSDSQALSLRSPKKRRFSLKPEATRSWMIPRIGAYPVPGPTMMMGVLPEEGKRKAVPVSFTRAIQAKISSSLPASEETDSFGTGIGDLARKFEQRP